jgi:hypothetical protein
VSGSDCFHDAGRRALWIDGGQRASGHVVHYRHAVRASENALRHASLESCRAAMPVMIGACRAEGSDHHAVERRGAPLRHGCHRLSLTQAGVGVSNHSAHHQKHHHSRQNADPVSR